MKSCYLTRGYFKTGFETVVDAACVRISDAGSIHHGVLKCPLMFRLSLILVGFKVVRLFNNQSILL
jgi:hypothetical protein